MRCSAYYKRGIRRRFLLAFLRFPVPEPGYRHGFRHAKWLNPGNPVDSIRCGRARGKAHGQCIAVNYHQFHGWSVLALVIFEWSCRLVIHALFIFTFISRNLT